MKRKPINPQAVFWPIADALREAKSRNPKIKKREFVKKRLASVVGVQAGTINPKQEQVLDTYVSKIVRLAFPANPAAAAALQEARDRGQNVNECLKIARGKPAGEKAGKKNKKGAPRRPGPLFAGKLKKLISESRAQGLRVLRAVRILVRNANRLLLEKKGKPPKKRK